MATGRAGRRARRAVAGPGELSEASGGRSDEPCRRRRAFGIVAGVNSNQLISTTAVQAGLLALGLAIFDVGGLWLWLPLALVTIGALLLAQARASFVVPALAAALLLWPAAALLDGWSDARMAWLAAPLLYPAAALLGAAFARVTSARTRSP